MKSTYYFQYNLPADNHINGNTDHYIDIKSERLSSSYDVVYTYPLVEKIDLRVVRDWRKVLNDIEDIGEEHFKEIIRQEKIEEAKAVLANAKEIGTITINELGKAEVA